MQEDKHKRLSERRKDGYDKKQAKATKEKGLIIVNTGSGKGKTTAALGMGIRTLGHNKKLAIVQFIKGAMETAERKFLAQQDLCDFISIGDGFTWLTQNRQQDMATAEKAWQQARSMILDAQYHMVILDELNIVLKYEYIPVQEVIDTLQARDPMKHVVITGRHAPQALLDVADLVSEIRPIKHPYKEQGVKAQIGVEY